MCFIVCVVCLCTILSLGKSIDIQPVTIQDTSSPVEFPKKSDSSTPIIVGDNPKSSNVPPRIFPTKFPYKDSIGPSIITGSSVNITEKTQKDEESKLNLTHRNISEIADPKVLENTTKSESHTTTSEKAKVEQPTPEQEDMLHSKYKGGQDVDELLKPEKKASEKDEKKSTGPKKDPKTEVSVSPGFEDKGPKLMNETKGKSGESMLESTSKMMAVSSSVLANTQTKHHGIIEPAKTVATVLLSVVVILCLGAIGLLVWKKIAMRRFGRDVLINEDDFDEVADMHTFDRAQIQIT